MPTRTSVTSFARIASMVHPCASTSRCAIANPNPVPPALVVNQGAKIAEGLKRAIPMRRLGQPDDYPGLVAFLLSDDAGFMTGQTISVSGGLTMA